jgi:hypothetical protein
MRRGGLAIAGLVATALAMPLTAEAATTLPVGATQTTVGFCEQGPAGVTNPGATAPVGCVGTSSGAITATMCKDADVHAFVRTEIMMGGKRPALAPLSGMVAVHVQNPDFGFSQNVTTYSDSGTALVQIGPMPPGTYEATASLWTGVATLSDGTVATYPASSSSMTLVVSESPCSGAPAPTSSSGKPGCGLGDTKHERAPDPDKKCPTK